MGVLMGEMQDSPGPHAQIVARDRSGGLVAKSPRDVTPEVTDDVVTPRDSSPTRYTSPAGQNANLREWNRLLGCIWSDESIERAAGSTPCTSTDDPLVPLTLCW